MQDHIRTVYVLWGTLALLVVAQGLWGMFFSYPIGLERMLRRGRSWVYVPMNWQGFRKIQILFVSRMLVLGITATATWLTVLLFIQREARKHPSLWIFGAVALAYVAASWLQGLWAMQRYRQQEDAYYLLHDELRDKLVTENKDYNESQVRSLAAYQHQQRLRKADEEGKFLAVLQEEALRFRQARPATSAPHHAPNTSEG